MFKSWISHNKRYSFIPFTFPCSVGIEYTVVGRRVENSLNLRGLRLRTIKNMAYDLPKHLLILLLLLLHVCVFKVI